MNPRKKRDDSELNRKDIVELGRMAAVLMNVVKVIYPPAPPEKSAEDLKREDDALRKKLENILAALCEEEEGKGDGGDADGVPAGPSNLAQQ